MVVNTSKRKSNVDCATNIDGHHDVMDELKLVEKELKFLEQRDMEGSNHIQGNSCIQKEAPKGSQALPPLEAENCPDQLKKSMLCSFEEIQTKKLLELQKLNSNSEKNAVKRGSSDISNVRKKFTARKSVSQPDFRKKNISTGEHSKAANSLLSSEKPKDNAKDVKSTSTIPECTSIKNARKVPFNNVEVGENAQTHLPISTSKDVLLVENPTLAMSSTNKVTKSDFDADSLKHDVIKNDILSKAEVSLKKDKSNVLTEFESDFESLDDAEENRLLENGCANDETWTVIDSLEDEFVGKGNDGQSLKLAMSPSPSSANSVSDTLGLEEDATYSDKNACSKLKPEVLSEEFSKNILDDINSDTLMNGNVSSFREVAFPKDTAEKLCVIDSKVKPPISNSDIQRTDKMQPSVLSSSGIGDLSDEEIVESQNLEMFTSADGCSRKLSLIGKVSKINVPSRNVTLAGSKVFDRLLSVADEEAVDDPLPSDAVSLPNSQVTLKSNVNEECLETVVDKAPDNCTEISNSNLKAKTSEVNVTCRNDALKADSKVIDKPFSVADEEAEDDPLPFDDDSLINSEETSDMDEEYLETVIDKSPESCAEALNSNLKAKTSEVNATCRNDALKAGSKALDKLFSAADEEAADDPLPFDDDSLLNSEETSDMDEYLETVTEKSPENCAEISNPNLKAKTSGVNDGKLNVISKTKDDEMVKTVDKFSKNSTVNKQISGTGDKRLAINKEKSESDNDSVNLPCKEDRKFDFSDENVDQLSENGEVNVASDKIVKAVDQLNKNRSVDVQISERSVNRVAINIDGKAPVPDDNVILMCNENGKMDFSEGAVSSYTASKMKNKQCLKFEHKFHNKILDSLLNKKVDGQDQAVMADILNKLLTDVVSHESPFDVNGVGHDDRDKISSRKRNADLNDENVLDTCKKVKVESDGNIKSISEDKKPVPSRLPNNKEAELSPPPTEVKSKVSSKNIFQLFSESSLNFSKVDTSKLDSDKAEDKTDECSDKSASLRKRKLSGCNGKSLVKTIKLEPPDSNDDAKENLCANVVLKSGSEMVSDISMKAKATKSLEKIQITKEKLEELINARVKSSINEHVQHVVSKFNIKFQDLCAKLEREKAHSRRLQTEVTQLNVSLSKAAVEFKYMNTNRKAKLSQRSVGLQVRTIAINDSQPPPLLVPNEPQDHWKAKNPSESKQSDRRPIEPTPPTLVKSVVPRTSQTQSILNNSAKTNFVPSARKSFPMRSKGGIIDDLVPSSVRTLPKNSSTASIPRITTSSLLSSSSNSMLVSQLNSSPKLTSAAAIPNRVYVPTTSGSSVNTAANSANRNNVQAKKLNPQTSVVKVIDLTADEEEAKLQKVGQIKTYSKPPGITVGQKVMISTSLVPSSNSGIRPVVVSAPTQTNPVITKSAGTYILASQAGIQSQILSSGQPILFTSQGTPAGTLLIKTNNFPPQPIQPKSVVQTSSSSSSVVVNTVRLPSSVDCIAPIPTSLSTSGTLVKVNQARNITTTMTSKPSTVAVNNPIQFKTNPVSANCSLLKHPAALPRLTASIVEVANGKSPPPKPMLRTSRVSNGIVLSWSMDLNDRHAKISNYMLYAYQETNVPPNVNMWKKVGDVKALPLPMACTLTQFLEGNQYHFAVCAVDVHRRIGPFSVPGSIMLTATKSPPKTC